MRKSQHHSATECAYSVFLSFIFIQLLFPSSKCLNWCTEFCSFSAPPFPSKASGPAVNSCLCFSWNSRYLPPEHEGMLTRVSSLVCVLRAGQFLSKSRNISAPLIPRAKLWVCSNTQQCPWRGEDTCQRRCHALWRSSLLSALLLQLLGPGH